MTTNDDTLLHMFPTSIMTVNMTGHPCKARALEIIDSSSTNDHVLLSNGKSNFDEYGGLLFQPALEQLKNDIQNSVHKFATALGIFPIKIANNWFNIMGPGGTVRAHRHPGSIISGAYYIRAPEGSSSIHFNNPLNPARMLERAQYPNPFNVTEQYVTCTEDTLVLFPSWLEHYTNENDNDSGTVMSFNTDYLQP